MHFGFVSLLTALFTTGVVRSKQGREEKTAQILIFVIQALNENLEGLHVPSTQVLSPNSEITD